MGEVVELAGSLSAAPAAGWETGHGLCIKCLAAFVQMLPADAPDLNECSQCHQMAVRVATTRELMLIEERSNIDRVLADPSQYRVEVWGAKAMAQLSGLLVDGIITSLLRDRLRQIQCLLEESAKTEAAKGAGIV